MNKFMASAIVSVSVFTMSCGAMEHSADSEMSVFLEGGGWRVEDSPYNLKPGSTIGVCDTGVKQGVANLVVQAVNTWLEVGGRDSRVKVSKTCTADRILKLVRVDDDVDYYGQVSPLQGKVYVVNVPDKWAGHWTSNHEVGHIFGFGHIFNGTVSIMNSEQNGAYMNGGRLSSYDKSEVKRMLSSYHFTLVNRLWVPSAATPATTGTAAPAHEEPTPRVATGSCTGANGTTIYAHGTVTTYKGNTYTCNKGKWVFSAGIH
ncbi:MAG TPA: hypothetical protein VE954_06085 [Oligoflexus sp.]|uniref:hypothetical protein n=1 Tax=Oligoflexus sp. TaxID=1971216 RepID=UPI002D5C8EA1|nr:hypothetical protein [Oligoflexus sp.]HYX32663.1 hypothetical protein [Oligoflexus sp.]